MRENLTLHEFLTFLATCSGDEAISKISQFQSGGLSVEDIGIDELESDSE